MRICDFPLVTNCNYGRMSSTVSEILVFKARKWLVPPTNPLFDAPARGGAPEFMDETYPTKLEGWGYTVR